MVGKSLRPQGAVIRTYGRLHPVRRLQPQTWISPAADRKRIFSSSSSHLSSPSDDSDFLPSKSKKSAPCRKRQQKPLSEKPPFTKKRRKKRSLKKDPPKTDSPAPPTSDDKENGCPPERISDSPLLFKTPYRRFVTYRRKAAAAAVITMKHTSGRSRRRAIPSLSSDSIDDFEEKKRKLSTDRTIVLDASMDALASPLHKTPLLSSTPSVLLTALPRRANSFVRQLALYEPLEESVVRCFDEERKEEILSYGGITRTEETPGVPMGDDQKSEVQQCSIIEKEEEPDVPLFDSPINGSYPNTSGSGVKCMSIKVSRGTSRLCLLSPVMISSSESQSVVLLDEKPSKPSKEEDDVCTSLELFSNHDGSRECQANHSAATLDGSPSAGFLRGISPNKRQPSSRKSLQPVVRLRPEAVTEYLRSRMASRAQRSGKKRSEVLQQKSENSPGVQSCPNNNAGEIVLPEKDLCLSRMQPIVSLSRDSVTKFLHEKDVSQPREKPPGTEGTLTFQAGLQTPLVTSSVLKSRAQETTGRKVCISGFSMKRWGNHRKKLANAQQQLSFQDYNEASLKCVEDVVAGRGLSPTLFSSSMLTSSFLNSSTVRNLNLSSDSLCLRDPQREHQRWARLRAALSLHRKKKVEAGLSPSYPIDRRNGRRSVTANNSSLLLLSPFQASLCCEDLTDAEKVLAECQQEKPIPFHQCLTVEQLQRCQKVGEGVYGEVFRTLRGGRHVALKVIPIEGSGKVNGEYQKSFAEILPEIIISKELSLLSAGEKNTTSGFIKLHSAHCVQGSYPAELLSAWDNFDEEKGTDNERPDLFGEEQLFMILEFEFGGDDLERMSDKLPSVSVSRSILHQVTAALAVAEEELRFEHRDLHWGNLLIENTSVRTLSATLQGDLYHIPSAGVQVKIIDYTLSRLDKDGLTVFCDLSTDEELFIGEGDLQFDVYRSMRKENQNSWSVYSPHSNVLWLHYLCDKLLTEVQYVRKPTTAAYKKELRQLRDFRRDVRKFCSAADVLLRSKLFSN